MGLLEVEWPPPARRSATYRYAMAKRRMEEDEPRSVISTRNSAALLEAREFLHQFESVIHRLNGPSRRQKVPNFAEEFLLIEISSFPGPGFYNKEWYRTALEKRNKPRNRYISTYANETSRVVLKQLPDPNASDYINANHIRGVPYQVRYIATQSPLPNTVEHFWQMVWEQGSQIVLMLTKLVENGKKKGDVYWPETDEFLGGSIPSVKETYGVFQVTQTCKPVRYHGGIKLRMLRLRKLDAAPGEEAEREISHIQYSKWADHSVPRSPGTLLDLLDLVDKLLLHGNGGSRPSDPEGPPPVVVHCSAGIGRTGTYCAVDIGLRRFKAFYNVDAEQAKALVDRGIEPFEFNGSLPAIVKSLKLQRTGMVQTSEQYRFCFQAIHEGVRRLVASEAASEELEQGHRRRQQEERVLMLASSRQSQHRLYSDASRNWYMHEAD